MKRCLGLTISILALSTDAWALCPNCLGQSQSLGPKLRLLGAFLLLPFLIALIALRQIRRLHRQSERSERVQ